jgi:hypothetical protein
MWKSFARLVRPKADRIKGSRGVWCYVGHWKVVALPFDLNGFSKDSIASQSSHDVLKVDIAANRRLGLVAICYINMKDAESPTRVCIKRVYELIRVPAQEKLISALRTPVALDRPSKDRVA